MNRRGTDSKVAKSLVANTSLIEPVLDQNTLAGLEDFLDAQTYDSKDSSMDNQSIANKIARSMVSGSGSVVLPSNSGKIDFHFDVFAHELQIGNGGEWWGGPVRMGRNVYHHRRESSDPIYQPVEVYVSESNAYAGGLRFEVSGGFGFGATFVVQAREV